MGCLEEKHVTSQGSSSCCAELDAAAHSCHRNCNRKPKQQQEEEEAAAEVPSMARPGYDAVVVGSGYGGGVAACRLAQAGLRVAVLERGKAWESSHFPTTFWQLLRNTHLMTPLGSVGNRNSLYQLYLGGTDRSCALVGCGLGGGSLVNAGIVLPAPASTRRHPSWPKQWCEREWEAAQSRAMAMLEPEAVPTVYPKSRVMDAIAGDMAVQHDMEDMMAGGGVVHRDALRGSFRFQEVGSGPNVAGVHLDPCVGCGNCVTGCTYNAKNSVDKNYIATAVQAGAEVHTECEVLYVAPNYGNLASTEDGASPGIQSTSGGRRWRVYLNEVDYVEADFVVLAAGTLGSTTILLRSKEKGLGVSERLGHGYSCNGNHVGIVGGAKAPTQGYSLDKKQLANIPMASRTGPCISSSHSSPSLGRFVVQGASVPGAYPEIVFKTILSNRVSVPDGLGQLAVLWRELKLTLTGANNNAILLNVMGSDAANGRIQLDMATDAGKLALFPPDDPSLSSKIKTCQRLTERLGGVLFMSRFRSTAVHLLGGCNAAQDPSAGVANHRGQVFAPYNLHNPGAGAAVHSGLYVCDGSLIPCSVGVNPTGTITTAAEIVSSYLVQDALRHCVGSRTSMNQREEKSKLGCNDCNCNCKKQQEVKMMIASQDGDEEVPLRRRLGFEEGRRSSDSMVDLDCAVKEVDSIPLLTNSIAPNCACRNDSADESPCGIGIARHLITTTINSHHVQGPGLIMNKNSKVEPHLKLLSSRDPAVVVVRETVKGTLSGMPCTLHLVMHMGGGQAGSEQSTSLLRGRVGGRIVMKYVEPRVLHIVEGSVDMCWVDARTPWCQQMRYRLLLASSNGARFALDACKIMNPFVLCAKGWQEATTLHATLRQLAPAHHGQLQQQLQQQHSSKMVFLEGKLRVSPLALLRSVFSLRGKKKWQFVACLVHSLVRTYFLQIPRAPTTAMEEEAQQPLQQYPVCSHHSLTTEDGQSIGLKQWPLSAAKGVVLMLNGYSTESFCLPTEPHDLVRTVLKEGYEPWLLQFRLHPAHACTSFTLDDLAQFDIPTAFARIREVKGADCRVHVVAHCVGGLSIHMALLGGHLPASSVASLACTNSAMFFTLTASARAKLIPPLIPVSMAILGAGKTVLAMGEDGNRRHALLRSIARFIPRPERCACDACAIFSGIFGSTFWHGNVTRRAHDWLQQEAVPRLPMSAFPHLRRVCLAERVVDAAGRDAYLVHPERLALPTTYISGGRPILVTPHTSERAHLFMRHHHPQFQHHRVLVPGYGHSDLLIGEHAHRDVFPHVLAHLRRCSATTHTASRSEEEGEGDGAGAGLVRQQLAPWEHLPPTIGRPSFSPLLLLFIFFLACCVLFFGAGTGAGIELYRFR